MAQLIKLKDYISRYEWNAYRYPGQYIRQKQSNWTKLYEEWESNRDLYKISAKLAEEEEKEPSSSFLNWRSFFKREEQEEQYEDTLYNPLPSTKTALKQYFLEELYPLQLNWATSTVTDVSFIDQSFETDETLKFFLQRFPDIYLLMYYPIFNVKQASVDGEIIFISPIGIEIIYLLEEAPTTTIMATDERSWTFETDSKLTKKLSPMIALRRMEQIINSILKFENINFPIKKLILSRKNNIVFNYEPYNTQIIGKFQYEKWFEKKRRLSSPLKSDQLKVIEALLKHCVTTSVRRPEWEEERTDFTSEQ